MKPGRAPARPRSFFIQLRRPGIEPGARAYETRLSTSPPASCRPGSWTQHPGLWDPVGRRPVCRT